MLCYSSAISTLAGSPISLPCLRGGEAFSRAPQTYRRWRGCRSQTCDETEERVEAVRTGVKQPSWRHRFLSGGGWIQSMRRCV